MHCGHTYALWSPSLKAAHFALCFSSCVEMLAFMNIYCGHVCIVVMHMHCGHRLQQLPMLLSVLLVVFKSGIGTRGEVSRL